MKADSLIHVDGVGGRATGGRAGEAGSEGFRYRGLNESIEL